MKNERTSGERVRKRGSVVEEEVEVEAEESIKVIKKINRRENNNINRE
jgi:hypothetical protein